MKKVNYLLLAFVSVLAVNCGSTTDITASYKQPEEKTEYKKVFIVALTDNTFAQQAVESTVAKLVSGRGATAIKSGDVLPPNFRKVAESKDRQMVLDKLRDKGCDGIITIALIDARHESHYVEGAGYYPMTIPYYGGFGTYYVYGYDNFYSPGYYTDDKIYYLETNLYDAETEKLVWSAQSQTYNPASIEDFLKGYSQALGDRMTKDKIMTKK